ncbi:MAG: peptidoglycan DD-metalloendopeptidase family protein [Kofleriaceae bacterium]|nr:peptidoglycan DD-metalloendopeptidase family protein [Kofleriaceae bacterium]
MTAAPIGSTAAAATALGPVRLAGPSERGARADAPEVRDDAATAAGHLEGFFLRQLLREARASGGDALLSGGFAGDTFRNMLDDSLTESMSRAGGVGLAQTFIAQLDPSAEVVGPAPAPATAVLHRGERPAPAPVPAGFIGSENGRLTVPAVGRLSSVFGTRHDPLTGDVSRHLGQDIAAPTGAPVVAAAAGTVVRAEAAGTYGNLIVVDHGDGMTTRYAHLSEISVEVGAKVEAGVAIGKVGSTGRSTGPHLHFEVRQDGTAVDPRPYLTGAAPSGAAPDPHDHP